MRKYFLFIVFSFISFSAFMGCSKDDEIDLPDGPRGFGFPIFDVTDTTFSAKGGDLVIKQINSESWGFSLYRLMPYDQLADDYLKKIESINEERERWHEDPIVVNMYEGSWFRVEKESDRELKVHIRPNNTNAERYMLLEISFMGISDLYIRIAQDK